LRELIIPAAIPNNQQEATEGPPAPSTAQGNSSNSTLKPNHNSNEQHHQQQQHSNIPGLSRTESAAEPTHKELLVTNQADRRKLLATRLAAKGLQRGLNPPSDGMCLYDAIVDQLINIQRLPQADDDVPIHSGYQLRQAVQNWMVSFCHTKLHGDVTVKMPPFLSTALAIRPSMITCSEWTPMIAGVVILK